MAPGEDVLLDPVAPAAVRVVPVVGDGCTVLVGPGTYSDPLVLDRGLSLIATDGDPAATVIDGQGAAIAVSIPDRASSTSPKS